MKKVGPNIHIFTHWFQVWTAGRWWGSGPGRWHEPLKAPPSAATRTARSRASPAPLLPGCTPHRTACRWPNCYPLAPARGNVASKRKHAARVLPRHSVTFIIMSLRSRQTRRTGSTGDPINTTSVRLGYTTIPTHATSGISFFKIMRPAKAF